MKFQDIIDNYAAEVKIELTRPGVDFWKRHILYRSGCFFAQLRRYDSKNGYTTWNLHGPNEQQGFDELVQATEGVLKANIYLCTKCDLDFASAENIESAVCPRCAEIEKTE